MPKVSVVDFHNSIIKETAVELDLLKNPLYVDDEIEWIYPADLPRMSLLELMEIQKIITQIGSLYSPTYY